MPATDLMAKMQADRIQMALVIDEYGGVDGLVTIEDLIEQVIHSGSRCLCWVNFMCQSID